MTTVEHVPTSCATETRAVGICSRCATAVILTPLRGATCACGAMQIPWEFFAARATCSIS